MKSTARTSTKIITNGNRLYCSYLDSLWWIIFILAVLTPNLTASPREIPESNPKKSSEYREVEFINRYCLECHSGKNPKANLDLSRFDSMNRILSEALLSDEILIRLSEGDMPPKEADLPTLDERSDFLNWVKSSLQKAACQSGPHPGPAVLRRLNRAEYSASVRDLLDIHFDAGEALPSDGSGGEGFDNASETLFISPIHAEKYMDAARVAVEYAFADTRSLQRFLVAEPDKKTPPEAAARRVIEAFLPRAFRRSIPESEILEYLALFNAAYEADPSFMFAIRLTLQAVLISPKFLFIAEEPNFDTKPQKVTDHELASRLSYFLWGSLPDDALL